MDLGSKNLNDLISKDSSLQRKGALSIIENLDIDSFAVLNSKSEFLFDFIKEKILKNLIEAADDKNYLNLFSFLKIYSQDFKDFILKPLLKFKNDVIEQKFLSLIDNGNNEEKTYAVEFFALTKNRDVVKFVRKELSSGSGYLKSACAKYLYLCDFREEYDSALLKLSSPEADEFEKLECTEFLVQYGDKNAFDSVYKWFLTAKNNETIASNLLCLKSFSELLSEEKEDEVINIYSSLLKNFPDNISFGEIYFYLNDGVFDFLMESDKNFALLLNFYLFNKINLVLNNEAYLIDLDNSDKSDAKALMKNLSVVLGTFDEAEVVFESLFSKDLIENLMAIELALDSEVDFREEVSKLCLRTNDSEVIISCLDFLKAKNAGNSELLKTLADRIENVNLKAVINSYSV